MIPVLILAGMVVLLAINLNRSDRRIDRLENRVALLSLAFVITVDDDGHDVITGTNMTVGGRN